MNQETEFIDTIMKAKPKRKDRSPVTGLYLDADIRNVLKTLGERGGHGARSKVANDALRKYFRDKELL